MTNRGAVLLSLFKRRRFPPEIILLCVRWYGKYGISYRDLAEMMQEGGVSVAHHEAACVDHEDDPAPSTPALSAPRDLLRSGSFSRLPRPRSRVEWVNC